MKSLYQAMQREQRMERCLLKREKTTKQTSLGLVEVKICELPSG